MSRRFLQSPRSLWHCVSKRTAISDAKFETGGYVDRQGNIRFRIYLVQETASIVFTEDSCKSPRGVFERLNILDFNEKDVAGFGSLNLKWSGQVMDLSQVDVLDIIGAVVVLDLPTCPVETFNLHRLPILDGSTEGYLSRCQQHPVYGSF